MSDLEPTPEADDQEDSWPVPDPPQGSGLQAQKAAQSPKGAGESAFLLNLISPDSRKALIPLAELEADELLEAFLSGGSRPARMSTLGLTSTQASRISSLAGTVATGNYESPTLENLALIKKNPPHLLAIYAEGETDTHSIVGMLRDALGHHAPEVLALVDKDTSFLFTSPPAWTDWVLALSWSDETLALQLRRAVRLSLAQKDLQMIFLAHRVGREQFHKVTFTDPLTGLINRAGFQDSAARELSRVSRTKSSLGLLILDIDRFKQINDTYGHPVGDSVLRELARILRIETRALDHVIRFGGEEFGVILPHTDQQEVLTVAERIRKHVESHHFESIPKAGDVTISIGALCILPGGRPTLQEVYTVCDGLLYQAKQTGRNRVIADCYK